MKTSSLSDPVHLQTSIVCASTYFAVFMNHMCAPGYKHPTCATVLCVHVRGCLFKHNSTYREYIFNVVMDMKWCIEPQDEFQEAAERPSHSRLAECGRYLFNFYLSVNLKKSGRAKLKLQNLIRIFSFTLPLGDGSVYLYSLSVLDTKGFGVRYRHTVTADPWPWTLSVPGTSLRVGFSIIPNWLIVQI